VPLWPKPRPCPSRRRAAEVRRELDSPCPSAQRAPRQRRQLRRQGKALVGPSPSRPFDLGLGLRFWIFDFSFLCDSRSRSFDSFSNHSFPTQSTR
jgi:hypothetical protein